LGIDHSRRDQLGGIAVTLEDDAQTLSRHPTLAALEPEALRLLAFSAETRILRAGDILFRRDDASDGGFFILSGAIALDLSSDGKPTRILGPGTLIGDMALITKTRRPATAVAREPSSILRITRLLFHRVLDEHPRSAARLRQLLADRLRNFTRELDDIRQSSLTVA
jgi:CRP-like cAMP-binding protein